VFYPCHIGLGIPEIEAKRYEGKIKEGNILSSSHTNDSMKITRAKEIFTQAGAQDNCATGEAATLKMSTASEVAHNRAKLQLPKQTAPAATQPRQF